jgi:hypothetical protein
MTQEDLGLADAYINGDVSFVVKDEGLLNFFLGKHTGLNLMQCCIFGIFLFTSMCIGVFNVGSHSQQRFKFIQPKIEEQVS